MAKFQMEVPADMIKAFEELGANTKELLGEMTQAGAEAVIKNIEANIPESFRGSDIMSCLHITKVYTTPSDDGINTKVGFWGYFTNKRGVKTPAELVVNVFEYGRSDGEFEKHPFVRKSFRKKEIMTAEQRKANEWLRSHGYEDWYY